MHVCTSKYVDFVFFIRSINNYCSYILKKSYMYRYAYTYTVAKTIKIRKHVKEFTYNIVH